MRPAASAPASLHSAASSLVPLPLCFPPTSFAVAAHTGPLLRPELAAHIQDTLPEEAAPPPLPEPVQQQGGEAAGGAEAGAVAAVAAAAAAARRAAGGSTAAAGGGGGKKPKWLKL